MEEDLKAQVSFFTSTSNASSPNLRPSVVVVLNYKVLKLRESDARRVVPARLKSSRRCWQAPSAILPIPSPPLSPHPDHLLPIPTSCKTRLAIHPRFVLRSTSQPVLCKPFPLILNNLDIWNIMIPRIVPVCTSHTAIIVSFISSDLWLQFPVLRERHNWSFYAHFRTR